MTARQLVERTPAWAKAAGIAATLMLASFGAGATTVRSVATAKAVPEQISELQDTDLRHDAALDTLRGTYLDLNRKVDRVLCLVEAQADVRHFSECVR